MPSPPPELTTLLSTLSQSGAEFVLVGGLAAVAQGAPLTTQDVDVVHRRTAENVDRLLTFLAGLNARHRERPDVEIRPTRAALLGTGHNLLMTDLGPLDLLGTIEGGRGYDDLVASAVTVQLHGHPVKVLALETLALLKRGATSPKDQRTLAILEETLRRRGS
jgi:predicted nucleotidyltransferase